MASSAPTAEPILSMSDANQNVFAATLDTVSLDVTENCKVDAETPARNVPMVAVFKCIFVERF